MIIKKLLTFKEITLLSLSVIMPAFKADMTLAPALESIAAQGMSPAQLEVVIAADDGRDYGRFRRIWPNLRLAPRNAYRSGPGATRNRGMALARGHLIAFLDADDCWGPGYLTEMMPLARAHGLAFARSHVHAPDGQLLTTLGPTSRWLRQADFGAWPGSFHPMVKAGVSPGFDTGPAQDVLHAMRLVDAAGGRARLADRTFYKINLRQGSVTADPRFGHKVDCRYRTMMLAFSHPEARQALMQRRHWNRRWRDAGQHENGFYGFFAHETAKN